MAAVNSNCPLKLETHILCKIYVHCTYSANTYFQIVMALNINNNVHSIKIKC